MTRFINQKGWTLGRFSWQEGFGAFSYSHSQLSEVVRYIEDQETHHSHRSFREEYLAFLDRFGVVYDEKFLIRLLILQVKFAGGSVIRV